MTSDEYILRLERVAIATIVMGTLFIIGLGLYVQGLSREVQARTVVVDEMLEVLSELQERCP